ncbi:MAG: HU family DNA-binding protein [Ferruginibacter sp.]
MVNFVLYLNSSNVKHMRKADLINKISDKTGIPKVDVLVTLETMFREIKASLASGENLYVRGFGSFIIKKRAAKIGRNIKKNVAVAIPEHFIPAFKPAKEFVQEIKNSPNIKEAPEVQDENEE